MRRTVLIAIALCCLAAGLPAAEPAAPRLRLATFNAAMGLDGPGQLAAALQSGEDPRLWQLA
jgi:hypothetical protein